MKSLVIVESPSKAKTINSYLGADYIVDASVGHIKDLPHDELGVDIEAGFSPKYITIKGKNDVIKRLVQLSKQCEKIYLATDPDREGEAIANHIKKELKGKAKQTVRVTFNEITKDAVKNAIANPREIDAKMVSSQEARRVMDRLIGYKVSPFLWRNITRAGSPQTQGKTGLSAGRVQSVALRIIVERERVINSFLPITYFNISASFLTPKKDILKAFLINYRNQEIKKPEGSHSDKGNKSLQNFFISDKENAERIRQEALLQEYITKDIIKKEVQQKAPPPFITSSLQQEASRKLRMNTKRVMQIAQKLYEGVLLGNHGSVGLITYMRTDSVRISETAQAKAEEFIYNFFGKEYTNTPAQPHKTLLSKDSDKVNVKNKKKNIQDAHEAIRPTDVKLTPKEVAKYLDAETAKVYELIWRRFVASQMSNARYDQTTIDIQSKDFIFRAEGKQLKFQGWTKVYTIDKDESKVSDDPEPSNQAIGEGITKGCSMEIKEAEATEKQTQPPPKFTQSTLVKELERLGIGRPSTYSNIVSLIIDRGYVLELERKLSPTELGTIVCDLLVKNFTEIFDTKFTSQMEQELDLVATGKKKYIDVMKEFYKPLETALLRTLNLGFSANRNFIPNKNNSLTQTNSIYESSLEPKNINEAKAIGEKIAHKKRRVKKNKSEGMAITHSKIKNDNSVEQLQNAVVICSKCGGEMVKRKSKTGSEFYGCRSYPNCTNTMPVGDSIQCPECKQGHILERRGGITKSVFWGCSNYPNCRFTSTTKPTHQKT